MEISKKSNSLSKEDPTKNQKKALETGKLPSKNLKENTNSTKQIKQELNIYEDPLSLLIDAKEYLEKDTSKKIKSLEFLDKNTLKLFKHDEFDLGEKYVLLIEKWTKNPPKRCGLHDKLVKLLWAFKKELPTNIAKFNYKKIIKKTIPLKHMQKIISYSEKNSIPIFGSINQEIIYLCLKENQLPLQFEINH